MFDAAGIPHEALNDIQSVQTLINIVTHTIEESNGDGTETTDTTDITHALQGQTSDRPMCVPRLRLCSSSSEDEFRFPAPKKGVNPPSKSKKKPAEPMHISLAWSEDQSAKTSDRVTHPSIPPLRMSLLDDDYVPEEPDPESLKPVSFLEELKQGAQNLKAVLTEKEFKSAEETNQSASRPEIRASQLLVQKQRLRSTLHPHPNQLQDLKDVSQEQIDSLASLLRKVELHHVVVKFVNPGTSVSKHAA